MIQIPLSQIGSAFAAAVENHITALKRHQMGPPGHPAPFADELVEHVISRQPQEGPVAERGPDDFVILPYQIIDDRPKPQEVNQTLSVLRETISG